MTKKLLIKTFIALLNITSEQYQSPRWRMILYDKYLRKLLGLYDEVVNDIDNLSEMRMRQHDLVKRLIPLLLNDNESFSNINNNSLTQLIDECKQFDLYHTLHVDPHLFDSSSSSSSDSKDSDSTEESEEESIDKDVPIKRKANYLITNNHMKKVRYYR